MKRRWLSCLAFAACVRPSASSFEASGDTAVVRTGNAGSLEWLKLEPARRRILVVTTSLKPGGPSEVIEITDRVGVVELGARRLPPGGDAQSAKTTVGKNVFEDLWRVVDGEKLTSAGPPETDPAVADGAGHLLVLEWPDSSGRAHVHALHWSNAKSDAAGFDRLFHKMAELARGKIPSVKLFYFP